MRKLFLSLILTSSVLAWAGDVMVSSPDGRLNVKVSDAGGRVYYEATYDGRRVIEPSAMGLKTSIGDLTKGLSIINTEQSTIDNPYTMRGTKASHADYEANKAVLSLKNADDIQMSIIFQVSNHDVAFRYEMPRQKFKSKEMKRVRILSELSSFNLPEGSTTFISPQIGPETGWEQTKPSYEEVYSADTPMTEPSRYGHGYIFPALFHLPGISGESRISRISRESGKSRKSGKSGIPASTPPSWILISETGVGSSYCGSHLSDYQTGTGYTIAYPDRGENNGFGSDFAAIPLPGKTPWRTITIGGLKDIVETTISYDLVEPLYQPSTDYEPGRYTWSWLIWQDKSINYDDQVRFIDLASEMGFEYCLVDNWWDTQIGRDRIAELSKYAQSKGVHLLLWYNSNGFANDAPQGPRDCMNTAIAREREMAWLQSIGVKGIKVDFFGGDKQETMRLYEDILSDANRYGLQVVFHGCTIPRGWEKMYPNFVASEAVLASENVFFNEEAAIRQPFDLTLHPFCRNTTASMDWGGIIMNKYLSKDNKSRHTRKTTDIFELASGITMQTSVQCVAMQPNNLQELPQFEMDFLRQLPTTWEETRFVDGYPGKYVVLARKSTNGVWYVAGLNAQKEPLTLTLQLPMFQPGQKLQYYVDSKKGEPTLTTLKLDKKGQAKVTIQPNGGIILHADTSW